MARTADRRERPYTEAAEQRTVTVTGWFCKHCNRFWDKNEHMARYCCSTTSVCGVCQKQTPKGYNLCDGCHEFDAMKRYEKLPPVEWDGQVAINHEDEFFFDLDRLCEWLAESEVESIADLRLYPCRTVKPQIVELGSDFFDDLADESGEIYWKADVRVIEKQVNDWVAENAPTMWTADCKHRLTFDEKTLAVLNQAIADRNKDG